MARQPDPELHRRWRNLIDSFDSDRWTIAEFCRQHEVSTASFYAWRRRLRNSDRRRSPSRAAAAFIPVRFAAGLTAVERSVQVHLPGGARVEVPCGEAELLLELIGRLTLWAEERRP